MALTSASKDRPCRAAATRSRAHVTGSSPRIVSVVTGKNLHGGENDREGSGEHERPDS
jgi:hypothetical protein